jgi:hypothetical protein
VLPFASHHKKKENPAIQEGAFQPGKNDLDGLSVSRCVTAIHTDFLDDESFRTNAPGLQIRVRNKRGVAKVLVSVALEIGLTVIEDPTDDDPGHAYIPEINYRDFEGDRRTEESYNKIRIWLTQLRQAANLTTPPKK